MNKNLLIFGCGYSAQFIAKELNTKGWSVFGTTRSKDHFKKLTDFKIKPILWDDISTINKLAVEGCALLSSIAPRGLSDEGLVRLEELLRDGRCNITWLGYLSSTGVYGDRKGGWVTEDSNCDTVNPQGIARVAAEKKWVKLAIEYSIPLFIFRLAGIYGPTRSIFERIKAGTAQKVVKPNQYFNRIHVEDIAGTVCAGLEKPHLSGIYNVADDLPSPGSDLIDEAARLMGIPSFPEVQFNEANLSLMAKSFYLESKRVSNKKLTNVLGYSLKYPTYFLGIRSLTKLN